MGEGASALSAEALASFVARRGEAWIVGQRERYRAGGRPLGEEEDRRLAPFFGEATRRSVRLAWVPGLENPPFYRELGRVLLDFTGMAAITFVDTVVVSRRSIDEAAPIALLFHELVHVVQYRVLGVAEFARRYVEGWVRGGLSYSAIPLEREAYRLQADFESGALEETVEEVVAATHGSGR